jgi:hypothetical protein
MKRYFFVIAFTLLPFVCTGQKDGVQEIGMNELVRSKWGFGVEFFTGYSSLTGELHNYFNNYVPFGLGLDISYKNIVLFLRPSIGFSKTLDDIAYSEGIWESGSRININYEEASLGYNLFDKKRVSLTPFAGVARTRITPANFDKKSNPDLEYAGLNYTLTYSFGANLNIKIKSPEKDPAPDAREERSWFLRIRYSYILPQFEKEYEGWNGNMHYITLGIDITQRSLV